MNISKYRIGTVVNLVLTSFLLLMPIAQAQQPTDVGEPQGPDPMITICHATSSTTNPFVTIHVSSNATNGHFDNNGTTLAGHEGDFIINEPDAECPNDTATTGTIIIKKVVSGGEAIAGDFSLHLMSGATDVTDSPQAGTGVGSSYDLAVGDYTVSETGGPGGYTASFSSDCTGGNMSLSVGETLTCTVTNTFGAAEDTGTLVVRKVVVGGTANSGDFMMHVQDSTDAEVATSPQAGNSTGTNYTLPGGVYTISESGGPSGYTASFLGCTPGGDITVVANQTVTCIVTNTFATAENLSDVSINKTVNDSSPNTGDDITYTITVTNEEATNTALNVVVTDLLPDGADFISSVVSVGSYNDATGVWTIGSLAAGITATMTIVADVTAVNNDGTITNNASVASTNDTNSSNDNDSADFTVPSNGGGGGGGSSSSGSRSSGGQVLGESTDIPFSISMPSVASDNAVTPAVLGEAIELPRTGTPTTTWLLLFLLMAVPFALQKHING